MCTTPEAFYVIKLTRALLKMEDAARANSPELPRFDLSHLHSFVEAISDVANLLIESRVKTLAFESKIYCDDARLLTSYKTGSIVPFPVVEPDCPSPQIRLDYSGIFSVYSTGLRSTDVVASKAAFGRAVRDLNRGRYFILETQAESVDLEDVCSFVLNQVTDSRRLSRPEQVVLKGELLKLGEDLTDLIIAYHPKMMGPPTSAIETNNHDLYKRAYAEQMLGRWETDRKIALSILRGTIRHCEREAGSELSAEDAFQQALSGVQNLLALRLGRMKVFNNRLEGTSLEPNDELNIRRFQQREQKLIDESKYFIRVLVGNKDWLIQICSR
jgi:hypothetical protein